MTDEVELTPEQRRVKERFIAANGRWNEGLEELVGIDPGFLDAIRDYLAHPWTSGPLDDRERALVYVALHAAPTTLDTASVREYVGRALDHGATVEELAEVVEIVFIIGIHSVTIGVPVLVDRAGLPDEFTEAERAEHERLKRAWQERRGFWSEARFERMAVDPGHFEAYLDASAYPWEHGVLDPKLKELVYVAIDSSPTHLFETGLALHVENALDRGATREEVVETFQIAGSIGLHSVRDVMPIVAEEARQRGRL